jgi:hypothetical protein
LEIYVAGKRHSWIYLRVVLRNRSAGGNGDYNPWRKAGNIVLNVVGLVSSYCRKPCFLQHAGNVVTAGIEPVSCHRASNRGHNNSRDNKKDGNHDNQLYERKT